jgi:glycosyltransferase involved in cell wall biosynthesis
MSTLSICMIVRDEEKNIKRCLESIKDVDEIIIVDTGSKDKTVSHSLKYTKNVYYKKWTDDFSDARNFAFSLATKDYIMWLDADEVVENLKDIYSVIKKLKGKACFLTLKFNDFYTEDISQLRIVPNIKVDHWFENRIHEQLIYTVHKNNIEYAYSNVKIIHFGYTEEKVQASLKRNLKLLEKEIVDRPDNVDIRIFLIRTLYELKQTDRAKEEALYVINNTQDETIKNYFQGMINVMENSNCNWFDPNKDKISIIIRNNGTGYRNDCLDTIKKYTKLNYEICDHYEDLAGKIVVYMDDNILVTPEWDIGIVDAFNINIDISLVSVLKNKGENIVKPLFNFNKETIHENIENFSKIIRMSNKDVCYLIDKVDCNFVALKREFVDNHYGMLDSTVINTIQKKVIASDVFVYQI